MIQIRTTRNFTILLSAELVPMIKNRNISKLIISLNGQPKHEPVSESRFRIACVRQGHDMTFSHSKSCGMHLVQNFRQRQVWLCIVSLRWKSMWRFASREGAQCFIYEQTSSYVVLIIWLLLNRQSLNGIEELD